MKLSIATQGCEAEKVIGHGPLIIIDQTKGYKRGMLKVLALYPSLGPRNRLSNKFPEAQPHQVVPWGKIAATLPQIIPDHRSDPHVAVRTNFVASAVHTACFWSRWRKYTSTMALICEEMGCMPPSATNSHWQPPMTPWLLYILVRRR